MQSTRYSQAKATQSPSDTADVREPIGFLFRSSCKGDCEGEVQTHADVETRARVEGLDF